MVYTIRVRIIGLVVLVDTFYHLLALDLALITVEEGFIYIGDEEYRYYVESILLIGSSIVFIKFLPALLVGDNDLVVFVVLCFCYYYSFLNMLP